MWDSDYPKQKTAAQGVLLFNVFHLFNTLHRLNALLMTKFPRPIRADEFLTDLAGHHRPRSASFMPPTALRIFPPILSAFPSPSSFLSPLALPATSFILPLAS